MNRNLTNTVTSAAPIEEVDVTAQQQAIFDSIPFSVIATDLNGVISSVNPASERMLGYSKHQLAGQSVVTTIHDAREVENRALELSYELGTRIPPDFSVFSTKARHSVLEEREWTYLRQDGSSLTVNLIVTALRNPGGEIIGFLEVASDVSERKRAEAYIRHMAHHDSLTNPPRQHPSGLADDGSGPLQTHQ
jgi:PAS domain S-box-containing protein